MVSVPGTKPAHWIPPEKYFSIGLNLSHRDQHDRPPLVLKITGSTETCFMEAILQTAGLLLLSNPSIVIII